MFVTVQDVVDFLLGYGEYLQDQGFVFDYYEGDAQGCIKLAPQCE